MPSTLTPPRGTILPLTGMIFPQQATLEHLTQRLDSERRYAHFNPTFHAQTRVSPQKPRL
jgi:hypothetical protein